MERRGASGVRFLRFGLLHPPSRPTTMVITLKKTAKIHETLFSDLFPSISRIFFIQINRFVSNTRLILRKQQREGWPSK